MSIVKRQKLDPSNNITKPKFNDNKGEILYDKEIALEGHQGPILSSIFNQDGAKIATGGMDRKIQLWNLPTIEHESSVHTFEGIHKNAITSLCWIDNLLFSSSADSTMSVLDLYSMRKIKKLLGGHHGVINQLFKFNDEDRQVLSCGDDGKVCLWDYRENKKPTFSITTEWPILTLNGYNNTLYFSGIDCSIHAYDVRKINNQLWKCPTGCEDGITCISMSPDRSNMMFRSLNGTMRLININESMPEGISRVGGTAFEGAPSGKENWLIRSCFKNNNLSVFSGSEDHSIANWDITGQVLNKFKGHEGTVIDVNYHPTEDILISSSTDGTVIVREI